MHLFWNFLVLVEIQWVSEPKHQTYGSSKWVFCFQAKAGIKAKGKPCKSHEWFIFMQIHQWGVYNPLNYLPCFPNKHSAQQSSPMNCSTPSAQDKLQSAQSSWAVPPLPLPFPLAFPETGNKGQGGPNTKPDWHNWSLTSMLMWQQLACKQDHVSPQRPCLYLCLCWSQGCWSAFEWPVIWASGKEKVDNLLGPYLPASNCCCLEK